MDYEIYSSLLKDTSWMDIHECSEVEVKTTLSTQKKGKKRDGEENFN